MGKYGWAGVDVVEDHDNVHDKWKCCDCGEVEPAGGRRMQDLQQQRTLCSRRFAIFGMILAESFATGWTHVSQTAQGRE